MTRDAFILGLLGVIWGLAASDMISSFHRLLMSSKRVRWDLTHALATVYVSYLLFFSWWLSWSSFAGRVAPITFGEFLLPIASLTCLFLSTRAILPDNSAPSPEMIDLRDYYSRVSRYVWLFQAAAISIVFASTLWGNWVGRPQSPALAGGVPGLALQLILTGALAVIQKRQVHLVALPVMIVALISVTVWQKL